MNQRQVHIRKRVRKPDSWEKKHVKKKGLRQNAPQVSIESMAEQNCCRKACMQHISVTHLASLRQHFSTLAYNEQNLYLTGLMIRKETKKSVGHKRKSNPCTGKYGEEGGSTTSRRKQFQYRVSNQERERPESKEGICLDTWLW